MYCSTLYGYRRKALFIADKLERKARLSLLAESNCACNTRATTSASTPLSPPPVRSCCRALPRCCGGGIVLLLAVVEEEWWEEWEE